MPISLRGDIGLSTARGHARGWARFVAAVTFVLLLIGLRPAAFAQTQLSAGIATGAISCAPSANATGHLVCAEYATTGALYGVSWQAPGTGAAPGPGVEKNGDAAELSNTVDPPQTLGTPAGPLQGTPGCGPENNNTGTTACLIVSRGSGGGFNFQGVAFYPAPIVVAPALVSLDAKPGAQAISNPSCASATSNGAVICAIVVDNQLYGIGFEPRAGTNTHLTALLAGTTGFTGSPSCASQEGSQLAVCAIRQGGGLLGFTLQFIPASAGSGPTVMVVGSLQLGVNSFTGDPSRAVPNAPTTLLCAIVSGKNLLGAAFNMQAGNGALQSLGSPLDGGSWTGAVGCSGVPDFRNALSLNNQNPNANLVSCAAVSSTSNVFDVTFNPFTGTSRGINGPFAANITGVPSCIGLAVDQDQIYCGATRQDGTSAGLRLPVGLLTQSAAAAAVSILNY